MPIKNYSFRAMLKKRLPLLFVLKALKISLILEVQNFQSP